MTPRRPDGLSAAAEVLGVHESSVRRLVARGELAVSREADRALRFDMSEVRKLARRRAPRGPGRPRVIAEGDEGATYLRVTGREVSAWDRAARAAGTPRSRWLTSIASEQALNTRECRVPRDWINAEAGVRLVHFEHSASAARSWDRAAARQQTTRVRWLRAIANEAAGVRP